MGACLSVEDPHSVNSSSQGDINASSCGGDDGSALGSCAGAVASGLKFHEHYSVGKQVRITNGKIEENKESGRCPYAHTASLFLTTCCRGTLSFLIDIERPTQCFTIAWSRCIFCCACRDTSPNRSPVGN